MKAVILISGGIDGNFTIAAKLHNYDRMEDIRFGGKKLYYPSKKAAITDMRQAYKRLKADEPEYTGLTVSYDRTSLGYDASHAEVVTL